MSRSTFYVAWWRRHRQWRRERFRQQYLDNLVAWQNVPHIHELADPHGKRLVFGGVCEMGNQCTVGEQGL